MTDARLLLEIAQALTQEAGAPWGVIVDRAVMTVHGPDAAELVIHHRDRRLEIAGHCGEARGYMPPGVGPFVITVADSRPAPAIAREIAKRLLPKYLPAFAAARAKLLDYQGRRQAAERTLRSLLDAAGGGHRAVGERRIIGYAALDTVHQIEVLAASHAGDAIVVALQLRHLDVDTACDVLRLLVRRGSRAEA